MTHVSAVEMIKAAEKRNRNRDALDRRTGLAAPQDCPQPELLRTAMSALECALQVRDWNNVAEAYCFLSGLHEQIAGFRYGVLVEKR